MKGQPGFLTAEERLRRLSASDDPLEQLRAAVDFEAFRAELKAAAPRADRSRSGRRSYDAMRMFTALWALPEGSRPRAAGALHAVASGRPSVSGQADRDQLRDRFSFRRVSGLSPHVDATVVQAPAASADQEGKGDAARGRHARGMVEGAHAADRPRCPLDHHARLCDPGPRAQPGRARLRHPEASHRLGRAQHQAGPRHGVDHAGKARRHRASPRVD